MDARLAEAVVHFYDVRARETLCGLRGFEHRSTKYARGVTCPACVGLLQERKAYDAGALAAAPDGAAANA